MAQADLESELERLHAASFAWALGCCGRNREEAEDVLQASYLKVLDGTASFAGHSSFKTFLFGVIRRTASEHRRRGALRNLLLAKWSRLRPAFPSEDTSGSTERVALLSALAKISKRQREVLELVFYQDLTIQEAAETLSISVGSARVHYERGKKRLFERLRGGRR